MTAAARYRASLYLLLAPYLVGTAVLVVIPVALAFGLAFTVYDGLSAPRWHGLGNFREVLDDPLFRIAVGNSLAFVALTVPMRVLIALALALLLGPARPGVGLYRLAVYVPTIVPGVAYALVWLWILNPRYGPLNAILAALGLPAPAWLADPGTALSAVALTALFQIGEGFVVLLAALRTVPAECRQASALDGAGRLATLRHITLPLMAPWLLLLTIRDIIVSVQSTFRGIDLPARAVHLAERRRTRGPPGGADAPRAGLSGRPRGRAVVRGPPDAASRGARRRRGEVREQREPLPERPARDVPE